MSIMPQSVLGGAAVMMFASILISGIELITKEPIGSREITIISVAIGLGYGLGATTGATSHPAILCTAYIWRFRYRALLTLRYSSQYYFAEEIKERTIYVGYGREKTM